MRAKPTAIQYNMCLHLCQILNQNGGRLACDEAMYYNFLDAYRVTHEAMLKAIQICNPLFRECRYPYIHIRSEKESGHADGEFYLTKSGLDWAKNLPASDFPAYAELPKEEKPPISREELHAAFNPEPPKPKKEKPTWTKEEVIHLMTNEAHVVGHMLGTGYDLLEEIHSTWINGWILNPYDLKVAIHQAHRDSFKTTSLRLFIAEMMLLQPLTTIVLLRKSEDAVKEVVNGVSKILDTPLFQTFAAILYPDVGLKGGLKKTTDTALAIDTNLNTSLSGEFQLRALGLGSPLTGKHAKIIITDDICFVAGTKIATPFGDRNIEDLKVGDLVITPFGYKKITKTHNREARVITNCGLTGTYNHPIYNKNKNLFDNLVDIGYNDLSRLNIWELLKWTIIKTSLNGMAENGKKQMENITFLKHLMGKEQAKCCTELSGKNIMAKFPKVMLFIIKTIIQIIIILIIYNVYLLANIKECTLLKGLNGRKKICEKKPSQPKWSGLKQTKALLFVEKILKRHKKNLKNILGQRYAKFVGKNTSQISEKQLECVEFVGKESQQENLKKNARQSEKQTHSTYSLNVTNAEKNTEPVLKREIKMDCAKNVLNAREIEKNDFQRVYNIEVEDEHVYYANRILVHNCTTDDRESEAERKNTIAKYQELMNVLSNNKGFSDTRILNIGTPWHEEDVFRLMERGLKPKNDNYKHYEEMLEDPNFSEKRKAHFREMIRKLDMQRGKSVYNCYQTGLMTEEDIKWKKQVLNDDVLFAANYLLTLVSDDEKPFKRINNVGNYSLSFFEDCWEVIGHIDCAYGGDDSTSLSIGGFDYDNFNTVVYGRRWDKIPIDKNYLEVAEILWSCGCTKLWLEKNADKGLMGDKFRELGFDVESYHESMNKHTKIVSTIRPFWRESGNEVLPCVQFVEETDENYLSQIYDYKKGVAHDDCPDNLACLLIKAKFGNLAVRVT